MPHSNALALHSPLQHSAHAYPPCLFLTALTHCIAPRHHFSLARLLARLSQPRLSPGSRARLSSSYMHPRSSSPCTIHHLRILRAQGFDVFALCGSSLTHALQVQPHLCAHTYTLASDLSCSPLFAAVNAAPSRLHHSTPFVCTCPTSAPLLN